MSEKKLLIVDDEKPILTLMDLTLSRAGYRVFTTQSGESALEILEQEDIPVMFFDLHMPGMDGLELCRRVKEKWAAALIFAMTGSDNDFMAARCKKFGFVDCLQKPVCLTTLRDRTRIAFENRIDGYH